MRSIALLLLVLLASCGGGTSPAGGFTAPASQPDATVPAEPGTLRAVPLDGADAPQAMGFLEYLPASYAADGEPSPMLVFLHGAGEAGDGSEASLELVDDLGLPQLIADGDWPAEQPFVVLAPQYGTVYAEGYCGFGDDLAQFLSWAIAEYNADASRVYLAGISCGAIGAWDYLASRGGETVAAAVLVAGHAEWALEEGGCAPLAEVPVWVFHGADDEIVPVMYVEEHVAAIDGCEDVEPAGAELTILADADHLRSVDLVFGRSSEHDVYAWLLGHAR